MLDLQGMIAALDRLRLLVAAARLGLDRCRRAGHLPRPIYAPVPDRPGEAILRLIEADSEQEEKHPAGAGHSAARHVSVLAARPGDALRPRLVAP